jgi:hypothetical protein
MKPLKELFSKLNIYPGLISRISMVLLVFVLIAATIWLSGPLPQRDAEGMIITPQSTITNISQPAVARMQPDILETTPTSGVVLAGMGIVAIILVGTAISIRSQK